MNQQELKHILSSKFDFEKWKDLLESFPNKVVQAQNIIPDMNFTNYIKI